MQNKQNVMAEKSSIELSEELFKLSGWTMDEGTGYSAGLLLRKLPQDYKIHPDKNVTEYYSLRLGAETSGEWYANYWCFDAPFVSLDDIEPSDTPEDALCKLAIQVYPKTYAGSPEYAAQYFSRCLCGKKKKVTTVKEVDVQP